MLASLYSAFHHPGKMDTKEMELGTKTGID